MPGIIPGYIHISGKYTRIWEKVVTIININQCEYVLYTVL